MLTQFFNELVQILNIYIFTLEETETAVCILNLIFFVSHIHRVHNFTEYEIHVGQLCRKYILEVF
jgi:hypothetical protein